MFTETLNSTSINDKNMELNNSIEELDDDDDDDDKEFPPLPTDIDLPSYSTIPDAYDNRYHALDLFYCASPPFPSPPPPPPPPSTATMTRIYANARTFASIRNPDSLNQPIISFATQQKKKTRAPIACLLQSVYVNLPNPRSLPPAPPAPPAPLNPVNATNEVTYATLLNTTSLVPSVSSDLIINHVEYQQIQHKSDEINHNRIYENIKSRRPPPLPCNSQTNIPQRPASWSIIPVEDEKLLSSSKLINNNMISSSSSHIYINLEYHNDKPPAIPTRKCKSVRIAVPTSSSSSASSPPPPVIPPRNEQKQESHCSSSSVTTSVEKEQEVQETSSNTSTIKTVKELEENMTPSCDDKSDLYRTKMPLTTTENIPSFVNTRQRRALHSARRRRLRGSVALRSHSRGSTNNNTNRQQQQQQQQQRSNANVTVRHPMITDDRWRRTLHKRRRQRALQMKLDGNVLQPEIKSMRRISDHTYNEIKQPFSSNNRINTNGSNGAAGGVLERAMQFNGALRDRVFSWYRGANHTGREQSQESTTPQVFSTSENGESDLKDTTANEDEEEEEEEGEEEEEFFTHDTFEDFLLRRRPKSSNSTTTSDDSSTVVSGVEPVSQRLPIQTASNKKPRVPPAPPPPPPPPLPAPHPPLPPTPPPARRFPGLALSLDKTDVDFIHNMLQRTRGDHRVWNRITALKEAYIRATSKKNALPKKPKPIQTKMNENKNTKAMTMKHSLAATKIRAELEKYDELPASSPTILDYEDDYDETCSTNIRHKTDYNPHHRSVPTLPRTPSTPLRILNFVTSIKRRAQNNVQQLQKNFHDIRSRVHVESMTNSPNHVTLQRHASATSRQRQISKGLSNTPPMHLPRVQTTPNLNHIFHRTNSHRSVTSGEHSNAPHRRQFNRTQSNASHLPLPVQQQRNTHRSHHRSTNEKTTNVIDRTPDLTTRPPPFERRSLRQTKNETVSRHQRSRKPS